MKKLPEFIDNTKAGFGKDQPGRTAKLVKRVGDVAMYLRDDGYYEVGYVRVNRDVEWVNPDGDVVSWGGESYWVNEDIGGLLKVKCMSDFGSACDWFDELVLSRAG